VTREHVALDFVEHDAGHVRAAVPKTRAYTDEAIPDRGRCRLIADLHAHREPFGRSLQRANQALGIGAVVLLQLLFTYAPPLQRLFDTEAIPLRVWPWLFAGGLLFFLVVEAEKLIIRSVGSLRRTVTAVEAGV